MRKKPLLQTAIAQAERLAANLALGIRVSPEDVDLLEQFNWRVDRDGYATSKIGGTFTKLHVQVFERMTGAKPAMNGQRREAVRHIIANTKLDCSRENIHPIASSQANSTEMNVKLSRQNTSGVSGVIWHKQKEKWRVELRFNYRKIHLGHYSDLGLAALVATTCREARSWLISRQLNTTENEAREYIRRVARAVADTGGVVDYRKALA